MKVDTLVDLAVAVLVPRMAVRMTGVIQTKVGMVEHSHLVAMVV
jgi:hypothetical protein